MGEYEGPLPDPNYYKARFVRLREEIRVGPPNNRDIAHIHLLVEADKDGDPHRFRLSYYAAETRKEFEAMDGGFVIVDNTPTGESKGTIRIVGDSLGLELPKDRNARAISGTLFEATSPGYEVSVEQPITVYSAKD